MARFPLFGSPNRKPMATGKRAGARKRRPGAKKKSVVKKTKTSVGRELGGKKVHWKLPGFDAFSPHNIPIRKPRRGQRPKLVPCEEITEPEKGIHSLEWAAAIVAQNTGFLKLPFEVRLKIYIHAIDDLSSEYIEPRKKGNKFWSLGWPNISQETTKFYHISRQVYVDFVGSSLLYKNKPFHFNSPNLMLNYLCVINPLHKNAIRSITLNVKIRIPSTKLPANALTFLSSCENLQHLCLQVHLTNYVCFINRPLHGLSRVIVSASPPVYENIRGCESLRSIRGLKEFDLCFVEPPTSFVHGRYVFPFPTVEQDEAMGKFVEEMRGVMVKAAE